MRLKVPTSHKIDTSSASSAILVQIRPTVWLYFIAKSVGFSVNELRTAK